MPGLPAQGKGLAGVRGRGVAIMFYLEKRMEISASHQLDLGYASKCESLHGHNWIVTVYLRSERLDEKGMVMDFVFIKSRIQDELDHRNLNDVLPCNPTAENIARWCQQQLGPLCYRVTVQESEGNLAVYEV